MAISFSGLATGMDTTALVRQLMAVESRRHNTLSSRQTMHSRKLTSINQLSSLLSTLRSTAQELSTTQRLAAFNVSSSSAETAVASASTGASDGSHSIEINQLAASHRWVHTAGREHAEDYVGAGNFIYSYNNREVVIRTTSTTSLEDLVGLINNDAANPGVTASLLYYANSYHLVLSGNNEGAAYNIAVNATNTELWQAAAALTAGGGNNASEATRLTGLDQFSGALDGTESILISGRTNNGTEVNHSFSLNANMRVSRLLAEIETAFGDTVVATLDNGVIRVTDKTNGTSQMEIQLSYNAGTGSSGLSLPAFSRQVQGGSLAADLGGFAAGDFTETQAARDSLIRVNGFPPTGWIARSSNTVTDVIPGVTLDLFSTGSVNLTVARDSASVKEKVQSLIEAYNAVVQHIRDNSSYDASTRVAGILMGNRTVSSIREMIRNPLVSQAAGFAAGRNSLAMPANIGLSFNRDGVLSLDSELFDRALLENYSGLVDLIAADKAGFSDSNYIRFYGSSSRHTTAGIYDVEVTVGGGEITSARIKLAGESAWRDATWTGNVITGTSAFNSNGSPVHPEHGLQLTVNLAQTGTFSAQISIREGFAGELTTRLQEILRSTTGALRMEETNLQNRISDLQRRMGSEQQRLVAVERRLRDRFARMERSLSLMQQQFGSITAFS
ncbi:MAG TPA: flagellar filament capping protein FliD [Sedimentisphaerales bacterium]|nr:flagellar filament capping protein FliD [Sedimentisphaerales bacterium]